MPTNDQVYTDPDDEAAALEEKWFGGSRATKTFDDVRRPKISTPIIPIGRNGNVDHPRATKRPFEM